MHAIRGSLIGGPVDTTTSTKHATRQSTARMLPARRLPAVQPGPVCRCDFLRSRWPPTAAARPPTSTCWSRSPATARAAPPPEVCESAVHPQMWPLPDLASKFDEPDFESHLPASEGLPSRLRFHATGRNWAELRSKRNLGLKSFVFRFLVTVLPRLVNATLSQRGPSGSSRVRTDRIQSRGQSHSVLTSMVGSNK